MGTKPLALVTGATGFAGSHVADLLIERGYPVRVLVRRTSRLDWIHPEARRVEADVRHPESLPAAVEGVGWILHFGGLIRARNAAEFLEVNAAGTRRLYEAFLRHAAAPELFLFCSTLSAVGPAGPGGVLREIDPPHPVTAYGRSKLAAEEYLLRAGRLRGSLASSPEDTTNEKLDPAAGPRILILRPPAIYGPRDASILGLARMIASGWIPLPAPPHARFSLLHVADLADATVLLAQSGLAGIYHLSDGEGYTWLPLARTIARALRVHARPLSIPGWISYPAAALLELWGRIRRRPPLISRDKIREFRQPSWVTSIEKIAADSGFRPRWKAQEGLPATLEWYRACGWL